MSHNSADPAWLSQYSTKTRAMFRDLLRIHDRPENQDGEVPLEVEWLRQQIEGQRRNEDSLRRLEQKLDDVQNKTSLIEGVAHMIATVFKAGAPNAEKVYPSKRKRNDDV